MLRFALPAVAALGLIAFAAQSEAPGVGDQVDAAPMGWHLSREGSMAKLAYGVENSDELALMMTCEPGQTLAALYGDVHPASPRLIRASLAPAAIDPLTGDLAEESRISVNDPALQALARRGELAVDGDAGRFELKATRQERRLIDDFFAYCGRGQA